MSFISYWREWLFVIRGAVNATWWISTSRPFWRFKIFFVFCVDELFQRKYISDARIVSSCARVLRMNFNGFEKNFLKKFVMLEFRTLSCVSANK